MFALLNMYKAEHPNVYKYSHKYVVRVERNGKRALSSHDTLEEAMDAADSIKSSPASMLYNVVVFTNMRNDKVYVKLSKTRVCKIPASGAVSEDSADTFLVKIVGEDMDFISAKLRRDELVLAHADNTYNNVSIITSPGVYIKTKQSYRTLDGKTFAKPSALEDAKCHVEKLRKKKV